ncbi:hypothetical protein B0H10DRAFT_1954448 [Mycena sp. CBHHK59/15]|nr:hypothetical protein B0H10DRAFT_1954448 [Mycena sp. CBHHK59/15]
MAPTTWANTEQTEFLLEMLPVYRRAKANQSHTSLTRFWSVLGEGWSQRWKEEEKLSLPHPSDMTDAQREALGKATEKTKERLKAWMRYQDRVITQGGGQTLAPVVPSTGPAPPSAGPAPPSTVPAFPTTARRLKKHSLFNVLKKPKVTRPIRLVEMYQKMYNEKVKVEVVNRGYDGLKYDDEAEHVATANAAGGKVMTPEELEEAESAAEILAEERRKALRAAHMSLWRTTSAEMCEMESDDVKLQVEAATNEVNKARSRGEPGAIGSEKTPEQFQHLVSPDTNSSGIDQIAGVVSRLTEAIIEETGWYGMFIVGGPMPNRGGRISSKTICFGLTPHGNDFASSVPNIGEFKGKFQQWCKRAFCKYHTTSAMLERSPTPTLKILLLLMGSTP